MMTPQLLHQLLNCALILLVALAVYFAGKKFVRILAEYTALELRTLLPFEKFIGTMVLFFAGVKVLETFGVNLEGLWTALGAVAAMVAIGFVAVWSILSNALCTLIILVFRPFNIGDEVELPGEPTKGKVVDLTLIYTTLKSDDGALFQVPNNMFFQKVVKCRPCNNKESLAKQFESDKPADSLYP